MRAVPGVAVAEWPPFGAIFIDRTGRESLQPVNSAGNLSNVAAVTVWQP